MSQEPSAPPQIIYVQQPSRGTNGFAITSLVLGILWLGGLGAVLAIIFGSIALKQTKDGSQGGRGLAIAGLILGIVGVVGIIVLIVGLSAASTSINNCYNVPNC